MSKKIVFELDVESNLDSVDQSINDIINSTLTLKEQYEELEKASLDAFGTENFQAYTQAAGQIKRQIDETTSSIDQFASRTRGLDVTIGIVNGVAGAFAATQGAIALLAGENEDLEKILVKVQGSLAVLNGLQQATELLNRKSAAGAALYAASQRILNLNILSGVKSLSAFRTALITTGIGAAVVALGLLIENWESLTSSINSAAKAQEDYNKSVSRGLLDLTGFNSALDKSINDLSTIEDNLRRSGQSEATIYTKIKEETDAILANGQQRIAEISSRINLLGAENKQSEEGLRLQEELVRTQNKLNDLYISSLRRRTAEEERLAGVERANSQRRISLIQNESKQALVRIQLEREEAIKSAKRTGEDIALINAEFDRKRIEEIDKVAERLRTTVLKGIFSSYTFELGELQKRIKSFNEDVNIKGIAESLGLTPEIAKEFVKIWGEQEKIILDTTTAAEGFTSQIDIIRKGLEQGLDLGFKEQVEFGEKFFENTISGQEKVLQIQLALFDEEAKLFKAKELEKIRSLGISQGKTNEIIQEDIKFYGDLIDQITKANKIALEKNDTLLKNQKKIANELAANEKSQTEASLSLEQEAIKARTALKRDETLPEFDRAKQILDIDRKLKEDQLKQEEAFIKAKLDIISKDPTRDPNEIRELNLRILQIQEELATNSLNQTLEESKQRKDIIQSFGREISAQAENFLSSFVSLLSASQEANQRLFEEGKISQAENESRQKKAFETQKQIEIGRTLISTYSSAQSAYQSQFLPVPDPSSPVRGGIAAGIAVAAGLTRVAAIRKQQYRSSSATAPRSLGSSVNIPNVSQPIAPGQPSTFLPSIDVFVSENDISRTQRRVRVIGGDSRGTF